ncbi:MAG: nuclear transport factor 2 family protein [Deltaproteobacteria bacterium]|nr:nuclear transport factor 2 family protein [Deltaproteobacteria bacterium]
MNTQANIETIKSIYAAFGRGDVPSILERLHPEVEWELEGRDIGVPWLRPGRGHEAALAFFQGLGALDFKEFHVHAVMGEGPWVVGLCRVDAVHRTTGKRLYEGFETHIWRFDDAGRITAMRHGADTQQHAEVAGL